LNEVSTIRTASKGIVAAPRAWTAQMIRPLCDGGVGTRATFLTKTFAVSGDGRDPILYISALGLYRAFINGRRVGDDQLTPGWTSYYERLSYQTYSVGELLKAGDNVIEVWLGDGWYRSQMGWKRSNVFNTWGSEIGAIAEIVADGAVLVATDATWKSGLLPILENGIYFGERYDAREEELVADQGSALVDGFSKKRLIPHEINGVKELPALKPVAEFKDAEGRTIYDFGQNSGGYVAFTVTGERGAKATIEHSEILDQHGVFENAKMRSAASRIEYTLRGGEES
jgi:alpha-L-rhamnosidase